MERIIEYISFFYSLGIKEWEKSTLGINWKK